MKITLFVISMIMLGSTAQASPKPYPHAARKEADQAARKEADQTAHGPLAPSGRMQWMSLPTSRSTYRMDPHTCRG
jgi:hypothetical protein